MTRRIIWRLICVTACWSASICTDAFDVHDVDYTATDFPDLNFIVEHVGLPRLDDFCWITGSAERGSNGARDLNYDLTPNRVLSEEVRKAGKSVEAKTYPTFGSSAQDGHSFCWRGTNIWGPDVLKFIEDNLRPG
jgi:hypothetical protein